MPYATVNSHSLHYSEAKPSAPSTQTIILIHGLGSSQNYYAPILPSLSSYRCITFDNYGAARSALVPGQKHDISTMAADVLGLLDHVGIPKEEKVIVAGHSMGGIVANHLASTAPERVKGLVLIGPVHPTPNVAKIFQGRIDTVQSRGMEAMADTIPTAATGSEATAVHRAFVRELLLGQSVEGYVSNCRVIERAGAPEYGKVECPVLIVAGEEDKSAPLEGCKTILEGLGAKDKRLEVLKGCGHWHCIEKAAEVGGLVEGFVDGLR